MNHKSATGIGGGRRARAATAAALIAGASGLHVAWGLGSSWPVRDRTDLADLVVGTDEFPDRTACFAVAVLLAGGAAAVAAKPGGPLSRLARTCVVGGFAVRGLAGITGQTRLLVPWTPSKRFVQMDRLFYGPLCIMISTLAA